VLSAPRLYKNSEAQHEDREDAKPWRADLRSSGLRIHLATFGPSRRAVPCWRPARRPPHENESAARATTRARINPDSGFCNSVCSSARPQPRCSAAPCFPRRSADYAPPHP
jgi:hypothetical protein